MVGNGISEASTVGSLFYGVIGAPKTGQKYMGNWSYGAPISGLINLFISGSGARPNLQVNGESSQKDILHPRKNLGLVNST